MKYYHYKTTVLPNPNREGTHGMRKCSYEEAFTQICNEFGDQGYKLNNLVSSANPQWMIGVFEKENLHTNNTQILNG